MNERKGNKGSCTANWKGNMFMFCKFAIIKMKRLNNGTFEKLKKH